jgi:hypothetical protein
MDCTSRVPRRRVPTFTTLGNALTVHWYSITVLIGVLTVSEMCRSWKEGPSCSSACALNLMRSKLTTWEPGAIHLNMLPLKDHSLAIFIVAVVYLSISFIYVCLRCIVRLWIVRSFGWDDALMIFALVCQRPVQIPAVDFLTTSQMLNVLFALCGITGSLYGIGQKTVSLFERGTAENAMFVCIQFIPQCCHAWKITSDSGGGLASAATFGYAL